MFEAVLSLLRCMAISSIRRAYYEYSFRMGASVWVAFACAGRLLPLLALGVTGSAATLTQGGYMIPSLLGTNPQPVPMFVDAFDTRLGTLNSASITFFMYATFQATVASTPPPNPFSLTPELVGYQAIVLPGSVTVGGVPIGPSFPLQSLPAFAVIPPNSLAPISIVSPDRQTTLSVFPFLFHRSNCRVEASLFRFSS